eukprot:CAMPEP_0168439940 /NCGR_PEP_ID=MMETSP0228-20121227/42721_1 /TAXON_ID=133427 /ORGANISM="Protoceratium reticulatum, Strain CCCM 535 (=CCMP 1889)" /LENGTH=162 /DNA_ID=CAMNT_0008454225 /DNA_START=355 /DNA_END=843 /DNA_ORIENTATION=-
MTKPAVEEVGIRDVLEGRRVHDQRISIHPGHLPAVMLQEKADCDDLRPRAVALIIQPVAVLAVLVAEPDGVCEPVRSHELHVVGREARSQRHQSQAWLTALRLVAHRVLRLPQRRHGPGAGGQRGLLPAVAGVRVRAEEAAHAALQLGSVKRPLPFLVKGLG